MTTAELKRYIDERTPEERRWMAAYLYQLELTQANRADLYRRAADLESGQRGVALHEVEHRVKRIR